MRKKIYLCLAHMSGQEQKFIQEAFDTNWVAPLGPNVKGFEEDLKKYFGGEHEIAVLSSATAAIHLSLLLCGVGPGDEVITQDFTFCASCNPIKYLGATPVFVDSEKDSWNMDPDLLEDAIKDRLKMTGRTPKAIVAVSLYGMPYQVDRIMDIAGRYGIPVVEDTAEAMGSRWDGKALGTFGRFGILSFNGNKMISTSGGGAVICRSPEEKDKFVFYATQARESYPYYQHETIGYNYRMSNICAGIGRGQMTVVDEHVAHHRHVQAMYEELLADVPGIDVHGNPDSRYDSNFWLCTITLDPSLRIKGQEDANKTSNLRTDCEPNTNVEALRIALDAADIESRPLWKPMHCQPVYKDTPAYIHGVSESIFKTGICLPSGPCVTDDDVRYIVESIKEAIV